MKKNTAEIVSRKESALAADAPGTGTIKILLATFLALIVATLMLTIFILPAEFNYDPLGVGQKLGIMGLSESAPATETVHKEEINFHEDVVSFELLPFEFVEYKYQLSQGSAMLYSWTATDTVSFDFHGEPEDGPEGFAESFNVGKDDHKNGAFTAPFSGIHGWFWENRGADIVTVKLTTAGFYTATLEFRDGHVKKGILSGAP
ncbi:MAG: hypothetical protein DRR06_09170 [Gammaproteobacteria bacterium]|nr:MAG: hypothetical protein DRR06_09170 [Gammaproteobacteria bacterium]RLA52013.1 MAG: hypothetical protein DRR42_08700 [Gammaproteobacteria bacterium]